MTRLSYCLLLVHLHNMRGRHLHIPAVYLADHGGGQLQEGAAGQRVLVEGGGTAFVAALADALHDGYLPQQGTPSSSARCLQPSLPNI